MNEMTYWCSATVCPFFVSCPKSVLCAPEGLTVLYCCDLRGSETKGRKGAMRMAMIPPRLYHMVDRHLRDADRLLRTARKRAEDAALGGCANAMDGGPKAKGRVPRPTEAQAVAICAAKEELRKAEAWAELRREMADWCLHKETQVAPFWRAYYVHGLRMTDAASSCHIAPQTAYDYRDRIVVNAALIAVGRGMARVEYSKSEEGELNP